MSHEPALYTRAQKLAKLSDEALLQLDFAPGSDAHYDQIMEICSRGLKDPEAGTTACNFLPELKAHLETRPRLGCHPSHPAPGCGPCALAAAAPLDLGSLEDAANSAQAVLDYTPGATPATSLSLTWFVQAATPANVLALFAELHQARQAPQSSNWWVRVSERLPEVGWNPHLSHPVFVFGLGRPPCIRHYEPAAESWYDAEHAVDEPRRWYSHWQPLPAPPRG